MKRLLFLPGFAAFALAAEAPTTSPEIVLAGYHAYPRVTEQPKSVGAEFAGVCLLLPDVEEFQKKHGHHAFSHLHYYLNPTANEHRRSATSGPWPAGSVLVKEKLDPGGAGRDADLRVITAVTGMIKGPPGSSPKTGDWQFFYFKNDSSRQYIAPKDPVPAPKWTKQEKVSACLDCHAAGGRDYVFARFTEPSPQPGAGLR